jgi:hypothetical protein
LHHVTGKDARRLIDLIGTECSTLQRLANLADQLACRTLRRTAISYAASTVVVVVMVLRAPGLSRPGLVDRTCRRCTGIGRR